MVSLLNLESLGVPRLIAPNGRPIAVKTRKALGILVFLLRNHSRPVPREELADRFWSGTARDKASQSLRQALRQLRTVEQTCGRDFLLAEGTHVRVTADAFRWDLRDVYELVEIGGAEEFRAAEALWRGDFMAGFDGLDPQFGEWLSLERDRIRSSLTSKSFRIIDRANGGADPGRVDMAARFLLHIDPALEAAHRILIRQYLNQGQRERALEQLKTCGRELKAHLDAEPEAETLALLDEPARLPHHFSPPDRHLLEIGQTGGLSAGDGESVSLPKISIASFSLGRDGEARARILRDEIVAGLSSYRSFDLFQAEYEDAFGPNTLTRVDDGEVGSYLLRFRQDHELEKVYIQFEDRQSGRILFNEIVDYFQWADASAGQAAAFQTVSRVQAHVIGRLRNPQIDAPFARWCQAESLIWEFSPESDEKALKVLESLEKSHRQFSMTYAGKASIQMKQRLYYPAKSTEPAKTMEDILGEAERAVLLDPWQPTNQRVFAWAAIQSDYSDDAQRAFREAGRLSPVDPYNLMSVAEGLGFVGDIDAAINTAMKARALSTNVPRVFYEYLGNIYFAAGEFETAVQFIERAASGTVLGLTTRVAALICLDRMDEALQVLEMYGARLEQTMLINPLLGPDGDVWIKRVCVFQDARTRADFIRGARFVRRFLLGELA
ncbi:MAG: winged helix-turn-helix domain-containing protein [Roseibium sp.]|nr:winged helix-turn-helix domain-containing protein [Roseibium sp.]